MPYTSSSHSYDPRFMPTSNQNHQNGDGGWGIDVRSLPAHGNLFAIGMDDKLPSRNMISTVGMYYAGVKTFIKRHLLSWNTWTSQSHSMSARRSLTTATPSPSAIVFLFLCILWYSTSALSSNTGKAILMQFRHPVTLTFVQFGFVAAYCLLLMTPIVRFSTLRMPTKAIIRSTLPMGMFQVVGHMFSSIAISRIPVSTVHTIKALSPLFTVTAYALLFGVSYSSKTYVSLLPLTLGVMLACSFDMSASNLVGVLCAFGSALVFVSQNIFFKKIMPPNTGGLPPGVGTSHKLDKLNLLLYSSGTAFVLMVPLWVYYDLPLFVATATNPGHVTHPKSGHETSHSITYYFFLNGTVHFAQNIIAFVILSSTSPVTYSIASLIKRVAVICIAIIWFKQAVHLVQGFGIFMTFVGLYMYNSAKSDVEKGEKKMRRVAADRDLILPTTNLDSRVMAKSNDLPEFAVVGTASAGLGSAYPRSASSTTSRTLHHPYDLHQHQQYTLHTNVKASSPMRSTKLALVKNLRINSPVDSYPSPPPSVDSPVLDAPLIDEFSILNSQDQRLFPTSVAVS